MSLEDKEYLLSKIDRIDADNVPQAIYDIKYILATLIKTVIEVNKG